MSSTEIVARVESVRKKGEIGRVVVVEKGGFKTGRADLIELIQQTMHAHEVAPVLELGSMSMEQLRAVLHLCEKLDSISSACIGYQQEERGGFMCPICDSDRQENLLLAEEYS